MIARAAIAEALDEVRAPMRHQIRSTLVSSDVVGLQGPAHVGKSTLLRRLLHARDAPWGSPVLVDLDGAYSIDQLHWIILRGLARAIADPIAFSHITTLDRSVWPSAARRDALAISRELGDLATVALDAHGAPPGLKTSTGAVLEILGRMSRTRALSVVIEHLEAPSITARHPVDVGELLWQIRGVAQRRELLQVVFTARSSAVELATGPNAAFHGDGRWITLTPPDLALWTQVMDLLEEPADGLATCVELTGGHVPTMIRLLADTRARTHEGAWQAFDDLSSQGIPYAARCVEHARSLHRLGGALLVQLAHADRPYSAVPSARPKEVGRALAMLAHAGLVYQPAPRRWQVTDPLVAHALRGLLPRDLTE